MKSMTAALLALGLMANEVGFSEEQVDGVFTEPDAELERGRSLIEDKRFEDAIEAFRQLEVEGEERRAAIEYNVGRSLVEDALRTLEIEKQGAAKTGVQPDQVNPEAANRLRQAAEAFERAYGMSTAPDMKSQASQAAGNAYVRAQDLPQAIEQYRRALVAQPQNEGARQNLARALRMMRMQKPPPPSESDEKKDDEDEDKDKDEQQQQQQQQQSGEDKKEEEKKQEQKSDEQKKEEEKKKQEQQQKEDEKKGEEEKQDQQPKPKDEKDEKKQGAEKEKDDRDKERARQILDAMRSRERPLDPQLMRERSDSPPRSGKDW